ncbi:MAG: outer membrane lipoprotein-sorting protein [Candidatus Electrothrix sp. AR4]|nr:outer membrane lipoprotein-sorting protein [Candidatus Electrothrix sp. AR4]
MKRTILWLVGLLLVALPMTSAADEMADIIKKVEENLNGKTAEMKLTMKVETKRAERTMKMQSWSVGKDKSFIKILYPGKDKGVTFLKLDNSMWQYVPRIEKTIKIPASMMLQSWMGSDFSNDDLVRESSISEDYTVKLLGQTDEVFTAELLPNEEAAVVWGKIVMEISKQYYLPTKVRYFDEEGILIRELAYTEVKPFGERFYPTEWIMEPKEPEKEGHRTFIQISDAVFDGQVSESYFTKRALKRYSD